MQRRHVHLETPLLRLLEWLGRSWVRWVLSPGLMLLPKAAESQADLSTHQEPPSCLEAALQSNLDSAVDALYGIGETAAWPRPPPAAVPVGSRSPFPSPGTAPGRREQPVPSWPARSTCPSHACPGKHCTNAGPRDTLRIVILRGTCSRERGSRVGWDTLQEAPSCPACAGQGHCAAGGVSPRPDVKLSSASCLCRQ